jgi:hypothetical protein
MGRRIYCGQAIKTEMKERDVNRSAYRHRVTTTFGSVAANFSKVANLICIG